MREAVIIAAVRTAVGRAGTGKLREISPVELASTVVADAIGRAPGLDPKQVEDVVLGCALPEGEQGMNIARTVALRAGLGEAVSGVTVNRFCASGLEAIVRGSLAVASGAADVVVAGGVESMSAVPMHQARFEPDPHLADTWPGVYMNMGLTAEAVADRYGVPREAQDAWALQSHQRAAAAQDAGRFDDEIVPIESLATSFVDNVPQADRAWFFVDEGIRRDTNPDKLASLPPAFKRDGTVTAGNSSQRSDGAAAVVICTPEVANGLGIDPLGRVASYATVGVAPEVMGIGPAEAIPKALGKAGLNLSDIGVVELNEAFAAQVIAVMHKLGLDPETTNPNGGAIALGHPLGATGAKLTVQLLSELARLPARYGMVTMCVGGGQGAAAVFEWLGG